MGSCASRCHLGPAPGHFLGEMETLIYAAGLACTIYTAAELLRLQAAARAGSAAVAGPGPAGWEPRDGPGRAPRASTLRAEAAASGRPLTIRVDRRRAGRRATDSWDG